MELLRVKKRFDRVLIVDGVGRGSGLAFLWMNDAKVKVKSYSRYHIEAIIGDDHDNSTQQFTGFYGDPNTSRS